MDIKKILGALVIAVIALSAIVPCVSASDTLTKDDFSQTSFSKSIDYFDYVRTYLNQFGIQAPSGFNNWHANVYMNYINTSGIQLLYAGLENITTNNVNASLQMPAQSFILHYKTASGSDALLSSSFLMLMAFTENANNIYVDSPDKNDTLYASISMGVDLSAISDMPILNSKAVIIPLIPSGDNLQWTWGMRYTNLTALWWSVSIDPANPYSSLLPVGVTTYDELTFTYTLTINPTTGTVTLQENHVIGRMRDLIIADPQHPFGLLHFNSTGCYPTVGSANSTTIYDWLGANNFKMSIVNYQTSIVADRTTYCQAASGQNISETETAVSNSSINTYTDTGEKIFNADFGAKQAYKLYNYTADPTESTFDTYNSTTRTALTAGYAGNVGLFAYQIAFSRFLPLTIYHIYPALFEQAKNQCANISRADYIYTVTYPTYSGFRVENDPTFTAYATLTASAGQNPDMGLIIAGIIILVVLLVAAAVVLVKMVKKMPQT